MYSKNERMDIEFYIQNITMKKLNQYTDTILYSIWLIISNNNDFSTRDKTSIYVRVKCFIIVFIITVMIINNIYINYT